MISSRNLFKKSLLALLLMAFLFFGGCNPQKSGEPQMFTGNTISKLELINFGVGQIHVGKSNYAVVRREWIEWHYKEFRREIFKGPYGVSKWDTNFTCTAFTTRFAVDSQLHYLRNAFHDSVRGKAESIAVGELWYYKKNVGGHAIVQCVTENGREFFEPQTGEWVTLSDDEKMTINMMKFD